MSVNLSQARPKTDHLPNNCREKTKRLELCWFGAVLALKQGNGDPIMLLTGSGLEAQG